MTVTLDIKLEELIHEKVATGRYHSADEVIREGVRLLDEHDEMQYLQKETIEREIAIGLQHLQEGRSVVFNAETLADIKARDRTLLAYR